MYLSNTNRLESTSVLGAGGIVRGQAQIIPNTDATIDYRFAENLADGRLIVLDDAVSILDITSSAIGALTVANSSVISASLSGITWPTTGSTSMSLFITGANVSYNQTATVSSSLLMTNWTALSGAAYIVSASVNHTPGTSQACFDMFVSITDVGGGVWTYQLCDTTNVVTQSLSNGFTSSVATSINVSGSGGLTGTTNQLFRSPFQTGYTISSAGDSYTTTFNPNAGPNPYYLASWVPKGSTTYSYRIVEGGTTLTVCAVSGTAYFSKGADQPLTKGGTGYSITLGSIC